MSMGMIKQQSLLVRLGAALLAGLLSVLASPAIGDQTWLAWFCLMPWLWATAHVNSREGILLALLTGLPFSILGKFQVMQTAVDNAHLPFWGELLAHLVMFAPLVFPFLVVGFFLPILQRFSSSSPLVAALQAGTLFALASEIASHLSPFTIAVLAHDAIPLIQVADLGGVTIVCFAVFMSNQLLANMLLQPSHALIYLGLWIAWIAILFGYGHYRLNEYRTIEARNDGKRLQVLAVQTNIPGIAAHSFLLRDNSTRRQSALELTRMGLRDNPQCEFVVWPEVNNGPAKSNEVLDKVCQDLPKVVASFDRPLISYCRSRPTSTTSISEAYLHNRNGELIGTHRKSNLVPFYEGGRKLFGLNSVVAGKGATLLKLENGRTIAPALCFDIHNPELIRQSVHRGSEFIIHMAGFGAFGKSLKTSTWDLAMARLRAIETRRPIVRAANRGHAGLILATGEIDSSGLTSVFTRSARCHDAFSPHLYSPYTRWGKSPFMALLGSILILSLLTRWFCRSSQG